MGKKGFLVLTVIAFLSITLLTPCLRAAPATKKIVFWSDQTEPWQQDVLKAMVSEFESKHPDVKVELEFIAFRDRQTKLTAAISGGTVPEVILLTDYYAVSLPAQGLLAPLDDLMDGLGGPGIFFESTLSLAKYEGHYYSLPYSTIPVLLWYRKDLFKQHGLKAPETWDDLLRTAKTLTDLGSGKYFGLGLPYSRTEWTHEAFTIIALWPAGGRVLDQGDNVIFNSPEAVKALNFYASLYPYAPTGSESWNYAETMNSFVTGKTAMALYYGRTLKNLEQYSPDILSNAGVVLPPGDKNRQITSNPPQSIGVFKNSQYPEIGKEFIRFFLTGDYYIKFLWATPGHNLPVIKAKANAWRQYPLLQKYPEILDTLLKANEPGVGFSPVKEPGNATASKYWQAIKGATVIPEAVQRVTLKKEDPKKAAEWVEKEIKRIIAESK